MVVIIKTTHRYSGAWCFTKIMLIRIGGFFWSRGEQNFFLIS